MVRYLMIDDENLFLLSTKKRLEATYNNLDILIAFGLRDGLKLYAKHDFDLIILSISAETQNAPIVIETIRQSTTVPIIILSCLTDEYETIQMYKAGADFCFQMPIRNDILEAFIYALYRRQTYYMHTDYERRIFPMQIREDFIIYPYYRTVSIQNKNIILSSKEFDLLYYLACNANIVLTQEQIIEHVWKSKETYNSSIANRIYRLRKKIEPNPKNPIYIKTVYGIGYKFCP